MEITPRRSLSLNFDINNYYTDRTSELIKMWTQQNIKTEMETPTGYRMSHSFSMDDTRVNKNFEKKENNIIKSMIGIFGSLTNLVSKIPSFMSTINNPLSVTVVSNEGIISPEYLLKNLTRSGENSRGNIAEIFADEVANKKIHENYLDINLLPKNWIGSYHNSPESLNTYNESNALDLAIQESLKHMKCQKDFNERIIESENKEMKINENELELSTEIDDTENNMKEIIKKIGEDIESPECEILSKRPHLQKIKKKTNTIARSRGKTRNKFQLRKSGVSQSKHRKERTKHNISSNIQDDLNAWEEDNDSSDELLNSCENEISKPNYPTFIETFVLVNSTRTKKRKQKKINQPDCLKLSYRVRYLPDCSKEDKLSPNICDFRQRLPSESSIDSEDSCCIVFEDGSESEYTEESDDYEDTSDGDQDIDEEERIGQKVRFNLEPTVHTMIQWNYAYRAARRGPWEEMARDRERFRGRINCIGRVLDPVLTAKHRECIWHDRFAINESINHIKT